MTSVTGGRTPAGGLVGQGVRAVVDARRIGAISAAVEVPEVVHEVGAGVGQHEAQCGEDEERGVEDVVAEGEEAADDGGGRGHDDDGGSGEDEPAGDRVDVGEVVAGDGVERLEPEAGRERPGGCSGHGGYCSKARLLETPQPEGWGISRAT
jgi:hypothetical protein